MDGGIEACVVHWPAARRSPVRSIETGHVTTEGAFTAAEFKLGMEVGGRPSKLPMAVVCEGDEHGGLRVARLYYRRALLDGRQHYRGRLLEGPKGPINLHPTTAAYQRALRQGDVDAIVSVFADDAVFDGFGRSRRLADGLGMGRYTGRAAIRDLMEQMFPLRGGRRDVGFWLEHMNAFDDGRTSVIEFNAIIGHQPTNRVHAGVACYQRDDDGLIVSARVYDESW